MKKLTVSALVEITPSLNTAKRILEHVLINQFDVKVDEYEVDLDLGKRVEIDTEGGSVSINQQAAGLVMALHCLEKGKVALPKVVVEVIHEEGAFVVKVNGRVIRNFMEAAEESIKNKHALRDMATICGDVTRQSLESLGFKVIHSVAQNVKEFKAE